MPTAISADGTTIVGWHTPDLLADPSHREAFAWTAATGLQLLGDLPGGAVNGSALDVSADGTTVVGTGSTANGKRAFRWTRSRGMTELFDTALDAIGVSADGTVIVGTSVAALPQHSQVFRWESGVVTLLANSHSGTEWASGVSADGTIVLAGWVWDQVCTDICPDGSMLWVPPGTVLDIPLGGAAISGDGSTIVGAMENGYCGGTPAIWSARLTELAVPGCGVVLETSADGKVAVGETWWPSHIAFIWSDADGVWPLPEKLEAVYGLDLTGWTIDAAADISADGRTLVGAGTSPDGDTEGWIAYLGTPPQPGQFIDIGPGIGGVLGAPQLSGEGELSPGSSQGFAIVLSKAQPLSAGMLFVSTGQGAAPFKGGTFYPIPIQLNVAVATNVMGGDSILGSMPLGMPAGTSFVLQAWTVDVTAPESYGGSNGLKLVVP